MSTGSLDSRPPPADHRHSQGKHCARDQAHAPRRRVASETRGRRRSAAHRAALENAHCVLRRWALHLPRYGSTSQIFERKFPAARSRVPIFLRGFAEASFPATSAIRRRKGLKPAGRGPAMSPEILAFSALQSRIIAFNMAGSILADFCR